MYALAVHGGAGKAPQEPDPSLTGVRRAALAGQAVLAAGGSALDAVVAAVVVLEDDPAFNAGTGAVLNAEGNAELDAGVMVGAGLLTGNVAALVRVRNPVQVARRLLEAGGPVLLAGDGAVRFARACGFADYDPITDHRRRRWQAQREAMARGEGAGHTLALRRRFPELFGGTVGAVAVDGKGQLAAATSTGGTAFKLPGRIGDSPVPGAGNYATTAAAVSATGQGELMLRFLTAKTICDRAGAGTPMQAAVEAVLDAMAAQVGVDVGVIAVDAGGRLGISHRTEAMAHAWVREGEAVGAALRRSSSPLGPETG